MATTKEENDSGSNHEDRNRFLRLRSMVLFTGVIISGATILIIYYRDTSYPLPIFQIDSITVSFFNISPEGHMTAKWDIGFNLENTDRRNIKCTDICTNIAYKGLPLAVTTVTRGLEQGKKRSLSLQSSLSIDTMWVNETPVVKDMVDTWMYSGKLAFEVILDASYEVEGIIWNTKHKIEGNCPPISVVFSSWTRAESAPVQKVMCNTSPKTNL